MNTEYLIRLIKCYADHRGLTVSTVSTYAAGAGAFYDRLRDGHDITTRRAARVVEWLDANWPPEEELPWPKDIPRPSEIAGRQAEEAA